MSPRLRPVFISVDPLRDTVGQIRHYARDFHPGIEWLTGSTDQVQAATKAYRVYFSKANQHEDDEEDYLMDHSIVLYLVDPSGRFVECYTQRMLVGEIADKIKAHMQAYMCGGAQGPGQGN